MPSTDQLSVLSLFTGVGGLDLGLEAAGFETAFCVEVNDDCRDTLTHNRPQWSLSEPGDVHALHPRELLAQAGLREGEVGVLAGGPPCQPFSKSSYWRNGDTARLRDPRASTLQAYLNVLRTALPEVLLFENVRGFTYRGKDEGLRLVQKEVDQINRSKGTAYDLQVFHINAADFGVPQQRERVFVLAHRDGKQIRAPQPTHGASDQTGLAPYQTAWDAIGDLDNDSWPNELNATGRYARLLPSIPEGHNYLWHTDRGGGLPLFGWRTRYWTFLLKLAKRKPSWTLQAKPGPSAGPFHWKSRKLSVREACRLQTIPDSYEVKGSYRSAVRQVGNAVPSAIGELFGRAIRRAFFKHRVWTRLKLIPDGSGRPPRAERRRPVPKEFLQLRGRHKAHPGEGLGPGARQAVRS